MKWNRLILYRNSLKTIIIELKTKHRDNAHLSLARSIWIKYLSVYYTPSLYLLRKRIIKKIGKQKYIAASKKEIIVFPNYIDHAPYLLSGGYALSNIILACNLKTTFFVKQLKADLAIDWQDSTISTIDTKSYINEQYNLAIRKNKYSIQKVINGNCTDISKDKISEVNWIVFGFQLNIDPTTHDGLIVRKSNTNGRHDGQIILAPIEPKNLDTESVYCNLIDNIYKDYATDYRLIYIEGVLDVFYEKRRKIEQRFANKNEDVTLRLTMSEFSVDEISQIEKFCQQLNASYGELDVLRDRVTRQLCIVDFAKTPSGPPNGLARKDACKALESMAVAFISRLIN